MLFQKSLREIQVNCILRRFTQVMSIFRRMNQNNRLNFLKKYHYKNLPGKQLKCHLLAKYRFLLNSYGQK